MWLIFLALISTAPSSYSKEDTISSAKIHLEKEEYEAALADLTPFRTAESKLIAAWAKLGLLKTHEAILFSDEVLKIKSATPAMKSEAELILSLAYKRLGKDKLSKEHLIQAKSKKLYENLASEKKRKLKIHELELKLWECDQEVSTQKLTEEKTLSGMKSRSLCLTESIAIYGEVLKMSSLREIKEARELITDHFESFENVYRNPPAPIDSLTSGQLQHYFTELKDALSHLIVETRDNSTEALRSWKTKISPEAAAEVESLIGRIRNVLHVTQRSPKPDR